MNSRLDLFKRDFATLNLDAYFDHCLRISSDIKGVQDRDAQKAAITALATIIQSFQWRDEAADVIVQALNEIETILAATNHSGPRPGTSS